MTDFISREELKSKIRAAFPSLEDRCRINEIVNSIPAADVAPVVHAEWIMTKCVADENSWFEWHCSNCGNEYDGLGKLDERKHKYCHHCGAKMDGGEKDATVD